MSHPIKSGCIEVCASSADDKWMKPADFLTALNTANSTQEYLWIFESPISLFLENDTSTPRVNHWLRTHRQIIDIQTNNNLNLKIIEIRRTNQNFKSKVDLFNLHDQESGATEGPGLTSLDKASLMLDCWTLYEELKYLSFFSNRELTPDSYMINSGHNASSSASHTSTLDHLSSTCISSDKPNAKSEHDYLTANLIFVQERFFELLNRGQFGIDEIATKQGDAVADIAELNIVISQLMQAQASVESYHNLCNDMVLLLSKAETQMVRARKLIEHLEASVKSNSGRLITHPA